MKASSIDPNLVLTPTPANIARLAEFLSAGKLVVVPTETVYGIAVNLRAPQARAAAQEIKSGPPGQSASPWVIHVATPADLLAWVPGITNLGRRLIVKSLPGPVAFEIKLTAADLAAAEKRLGDAAGETLHDGYLTLRCPDCSATEQLLAAAHQKGRGSAALPTAIIGAGTPAQPRIHEVSDLPESLVAADPPRIAGILDGGRTRYERPSTLVRIDGDSFSVVRRGVIDERIILKMANLQILFICSGNTCRSPMASALASKLLADRLGIAPRELPLRHILVQSAGLHANGGMRAAPEAIEALAPYDADLSAHFSQVATNDLLRRADLIYTMTQDHRDEIIERLPSAAEKTHCIDPDGDVQDPIGCGLPVYQEVAQRLVQLLEAHLRELPL